MATLDSGLGESAFAPMPVFSKESIEKCKSSEDFMPLAFELYKSFGIELVHLANVEENDPQHAEVRKGLEFQITQGMLIRIAQLMLSVVKLASEGRHRESITILKRCIDETALNIMYLLQKKEEQIYEKYRRYSLIPEADLWDLIERNIQLRNGAELPIETSMKTSILRACASAQIDLATVPRKHVNWGGSVRDRCKELGMEEFYNAVMRIPSHAVHGSFVDLIQHYLKQDNGLLVPKDCENYPPDAILITTGVICGLAAQAFCSSWFFSRETRESLGGYFKAYTKAFHDMNGWSIEARHGSASASPWST